MTANVTRNANSSSVTGVIAVDRIAPTDDLTTWETIANGYAKLIDAAAECYADRAAALVS